MSRSVRVDVEIYLDEFSDEELISELEDRKRHLDKKAVKRLKALIYDATEAVVESDMDRATYELRAGRRREALVWLERTLPREWAGLLS